MKKFIFLIQIFLFIFKNAESQTNVSLAIIPPPNNTVSVCKDNSFTATFTIPAQFPSTVNITIDPILTKENGDPWSNSCNPSSIQPVEIEIISINFLFVPNGINTWEISGYSTNDVVEIEYRIRVNCSVNDASDLKQIWISDAQNFQFLIPSPSNNNEFITEDVTYVLFSNMTVNGTYKAYYKTDSELIFEYANLGSVSADIDFLFAPQINCPGVITISSTEYYIGTSPLPPNPAWTAFSHSTWINIPSIPSNNRLFIRINLFIDGCIFYTGSPCINGEVEFAYRCSNYLPNNQYCEACLPAQAISYFQLVRDVTQENVTVEKIAPPSPPTGNDFSCVNSFQQWQYRYTNKGDDSGPEGVIYEIAVSLEYPSPSESALTLINKSHVSIDFSNCLGCELYNPSGNLVLNNNLSNCQNCFVENWGTGNLCSSVITDPVRQVQFSVRNIPDEGFFDLVFQTYKCVENNSILMDVPKRFNHWGINSSWRDECFDINNPVEHPIEIVGNPFPGGFSPSFGISAHSKNSGSDLHLEYEFNPFVTDLTVPKNGSPPFFGPKGEFTIEIDKIFTHPGDYQLARVTTPTTEAGNAILMAKIQCEQGLRVDFLNNYNDEINLSSSINPNLKCPLIYGYQDTDPAQCTAGNYYFYFDLSNLPSGMVIRDLTLYGTFNFKLQSCCPAAATSHYSVEFYLFFQHNTSPPVNPPMPACQTLSFPMAFNNGLPVCSSASCEWIPLSSVHGEIGVHCPGCVTPGIIVESYDLTRETFGFEDDNNNGILDDATLPVQITSGGNYSHWPHLETHFSIYKDKIADRLRAHFEPGDFTNGGYEYNCLPNGGMQCSTYNAIFNALELERELINSDIMNLAPCSLVLYIDHPVNDPLDANCMDCNGFGISASEQLEMHTQLRISVPFNSINQFITKVPNTEKYLISFDVNNNLSNGAGYRTYVTNNQNFDFDNTGFFENQKYRLYVQYDICGNFEGTQNDYMKQIDISNIMWVTGQPSTVLNYSSKNRNPENITELTAAGWTFDSPPVPPLNLVNQTFADTYRFWCSTHGGKHYFLASRGTTELVRSDIANSCNKEITIRNRSFIANSSEVNASNVTKDRFPFEFRTAPFEPQEWIFQFPAGFTLANNTVKRRSIQHRLNPGDNLSSNFVDFSGFTVNNNQLIIEKADLTNTNPTSNWQCINNLSVSTGELYNADQKTDILLQFEIRPDDDCNTPSSNITSGSCSTLFKSTQLTCLNHSNSCTPIDYLKTFPPANVICSIPNPLLVSSLPSTITVNSHLLQITVQIQNQAASPNFAPNAFIGIAPDNHFINWQFIPSGGGVPISINSNSIIELGNIPPNNVINGTLQAEYIVCGAGSLSLWYGWNCNGYPDEPNDQDACFLSDEQVITLIDGPSTIAVTSKTFLPSALTLCTNYQLNVSFTSTGTGEVKPLGIILPDLVLNITNVSIENCNNNFNPSSLTFNQLSGYWVISPANLNDVGFNDYLTNSQCFRVLIDFMPLCDYSPPIPPQDFTIELIAENFCGNSMPSVPVTLGPYPSISNSLCTDCFTISKTAVPAAALPFDPVTFEIEICNTNMNPNGNNTVLLTDILPPNFVLNGSCSFCVPNNPPPQPLAVTITYPNCTTITVQGYFNQFGNCPVYTNTAEITTASVPNDLIGSAQVCIDVSCEAVSSMVISAANNNNFATILIGQLGNPIVNQVFTVDGVFTVNHDIEFIGCTFYMKPGAQIVVMNEFILTLDNTSIMGCERMWNSIWLEPNGAATVNVINNSRISDAHWGIFANNRTNFTVIDSDISECVHGIFVAPHPNHQFNFITARVEGSRFGLINGTMKGQYAGQPNDYSPNGCKTGIELHDVRVIGIGSNASGTPNFFSRLHTGIASYNSNIRFIRNSEFALISNNPDYIQPVIIQQVIGGSAVVSIGQQGSPPSEVNLFPVTGGGATIAACRRGVYSSFSTTRVSDVIMTGVETGVYAKETVPVWGETRVTSCSISASLCGIDFFNNHGCLLMLAEDNRIVISGNQFGVGIRLQEITVANNANYQILANWQIDITSAAAGILSNGVNGARISHNNIFQNHNTINFPTLTGISLNGGQGNYLSCNSVHCMDPNYTSTTGLQFSVSTNNRIECNHVKDNGTGVFFGGPCGGTVLRGNIMQDNSLGLWLNSSATIGVQSHHGNKWLGTFSSGFGADNWNSTVFGLQMSKFEITTAMGTILHPVVPLYDISTQNGGTAPVDWFNLDPLGNTFNNCASQICNSALTGGNEDRFYERSIASDSIETLDYKPESRNMAQQYLFEALNKDDSLLYSDTVFTSFYNDKQTENIGKLYEVKEILKAAFEMDEADAAACKTLDSLISIKADSIALIDSLYFISNDTSLFTLRASIIERLNDLQTAIAQIINDYHSVKSALLDTAYQLNNYIIPEELPEENQQFGNFIYLLYDKFGKDTLLHYYQQIFDVASQCPYAGGPAVYALRAFVSLFNDSVEYNDAAVCQSAGYYRKQPDRNLISKSESAFQLIPNPADEQVEIKTTFLTAGICTVQLTDLAGKVLHEAWFDCKEQTYLLTTKWLAPGTYFVKLKVDEAKAETKKLVIIR